MQDGASISFRGIGIRVGTRGSRRIRESGHPGWRNRDQPIKSFGPCLDVRNQARLVAARAVMQTVPVPLVLPDDGLVIAKARPPHELTNIALGWLSFGCGLVAGDVDVGAFTVVELKGPLATTKNWPITVWLEQLTVKVSVALHHGCIWPVIQATKSRSPMRAGVPNAGEPMSHVVETVIQTLSVRQAKVSETIDTPLERLASGVRRSDHAVFVKRHDNHSQIRVAR